jgi:hypothetical protein
MKPTIFCPALLSNGQKCNKLSVIIDMLGHCPGHRQKEKRRCVRESMKYMKASERKIYLLSQI